MKISRSYYSSPYVYTNANKYCNPAPLQSLKGDTVCFASTKPRERQQESEADKMNEIASHQIKSPKKFDYVEATESDYKRLTSEKAADSFKRVTWTNPKDGKIYHILETSRDDKGLVLVRILDENGKFIKEAKLEPQKIVLIDGFFQEEGTFFDVINNISHGEQVKLFAQRNNPFAEYEHIDVGGFLGFMDAERVDEVLESLIKRIDEGEKIDAINCSFGIATIAFDELKKATGKNSLENLSGEDKETLMNYLKETKPRLYETCKLLIELEKRGVCIFTSAGNDEENEVKTINAELFLTGAQGVGSLNRDAEISDFSSSRNINLTPHYELGEYRLKTCNEGINITGLPGADIERPYGEICRVQTPDKNEIQDLQQTLYYHRYADASVRQEMMNKYGDKIVGVEYVPSFMPWGMAISCERYKGKYVHLRTNTLLDKDEHGNFIPYIHNDEIDGTSFAAPVRCAKISLNRMMEGVL